MSRLKNLQQIGIVTKYNIAVHKKLLLELKATLEGKYHKEVRFDKYSADCLGEKPYTSSKIMKWADMIITLGGDGTILRVARESEKRSVYVLGVNFGTLGFMTELAPKKLFNSLERVFAGKYVLDERFLLRVTIRRKGKKVMTSLALNDVVINQGSFSRVIKLRMAINRRKVNVFKADGFIVATPTGSTGHALSAGGPIVHPKIAAFVIAPICPSSLSNRPIVIPNDRQINLVLEDNRRYDEVKDIGLTLDGQVLFGLEFDDEIIIRTSSRRFYMIRLTGRNYYKMLRSKLHWGKGI